MQPLEFGKYYHIYNRGINSCNLFEESTNYEHFLRLYEKYILPIADTFAYCLMPNHFHFLVRIKELEEIKLNNLQNPVRVLNNKNMTGILKPDRFDIQNRPSQPFSHLFNAYTTAFNK